MVNVAFDAPVDFAPRAQIEDAERQLYELAESGRYDGGFQRFSQALTTAVDMAAKAFEDLFLNGGADGLPARSGNAFDASGILVFVAALATLAVVWVRAARRVRRAHAPPADEGPALDDHDAFR